MESTSFEEFTQTPPPAQGPARPPVILVFAILTFIGSGFSLLFGLGLLAPFEEGMEPLPAWIGGLTILGCAAKIVGASFMIAMKKLGFWLYTGAEVILIGVWFACIRDMKFFWNQLGELDFQGKGQDYYEVAEVWQGVPVFLTLFSIAWITVYATQVKKMR